ALLTRDFAQSEYATIRSAVHRFRAVPRPEKVPGIFLRFLFARDDYRSSVIFSERSCFRNPTCGPGGSAAGGRKPVRTIQASVRTASGANSGSQAIGLRTSGDAGLMRF